MKIPVVIEPIGDGFRATSFGAQSATADGETDAKALNNLRTVIESKFRPGTRFTYLEVTYGEPDEPGTPGFFQPNDPIVQEWKAIIAENRKRDNESDDAL